MNARPYILAETTWKTVKETDYKVAILPWGATEAHNYHLPYATDNYQADYVAEKAAELAWEKNAKVVVLPCIPFGINTGQIDIKLCMNLNPTTQLAILKDVVDVLDRANIDKLVIFNGHGGNHFKVMIRELSLIYPEVFVCCVNWYGAADWKDYFEDTGDHGGEVETSVMMNIAPHLVLPLSEAGDGAAKQFRIKELNESWVTTQRQWTKVSKDTGVGNPYKATAEKATPYLDDSIQKISELFIHLAQTSNEELY
ncbi:MAG: creatininase family protein [Bacteroidetes bacterium]|nr:creatininase family protein [Bacteroidota bacterium]